MKRYGVKRTVWDSVKELKKAVPEEAARLISAAVPELAHNYSMASSTHPERHRVNARRSWLRKKHPGINLHIWDASRKLKALARAVPAGSGMQEALNGIVGDLLTAQG